jgi:hypothetical protein
MEATIRDEDEVCTMTASSPMEVMITGETQPDFRGLTADKFIFRLSEEWNKNYHWTVKCEGDAEPFEYPIPAPVIQYNKCPPGTADCKTLPLEFEGVAGRRKDRSLPVHPAPLNRPDQAKGGSGRKINMPSRPILTQSLNTKRGKGNDDPDPVLPAGDPLPNSAFEGSRGKTGDDALLKDEDQDNQGNGHDYRSRGNVPPRILMDTREKSDGHGNGPGGGSGGER